MSKNKSSKKKTAEEKSREFSEAVEKKSKEIAGAEEKRRQFSRVVEQKNKELRQSEQKKKAAPDTSGVKKAADSKAKAKEKESTPDAVHLVKASLSGAAAAKYVLIIAIVGGVSIAGIVMCVLNIMRSNWFYAVDYLIAALLGISIVIVKVNTLFPTFVASDGKKLIMRSYDNNVVAYNISHKVAFLCDFIPAKTKMTRLNISDITSIIIGTKNYIKRHCGDNKRFLEEIEKIENSNIGKNMLLGMDMICFLYGKDECSFMSIDKFDPEDVAAVVRDCIKTNPDAEILCNNKYLRNKILFDLPSK